MTTTWVVGTSEFKTRAAAVKRAKEYANDSGRPETVTVERRRKPGVRGRVLGFSVRDLLPSTSFEVQPSKKRSNPKAVSLRGFTGTITRLKNRQVRIAGRGTRKNAGQLKLRRRGDVRSPQAKFKGMAGYKRKWKQPDLEVMSAHAPRSPKKRRGVK